MKHKKIHEILETTHTQCTLVKISTLRHKTFNKLNGSEQKTVKKDRIDL